MKRLTSTLFFTAITQKKSYELNEIEEAFEEFTTLICI